MQDRPKPHPLVELKGISKHFGEGETRGEGDVLLGEVALPRLASAGVTGLGAAAGLGLGEEGLEGVEGEGALGERVGSLVGLFEEGQHGLRQVGRFRP